MNLVECDKERSQEEMKLRRDEVIKVFYIALNLHSVFGISIQSLNQEGRSSAPTVKAVTKVVCV
jgi:hypothetical protein